MGTNASPVLAAGHDLNGDHDLLPNFVQELGPSHDEMSTRLTEYRVQVAPLHQRIDGAAEMVGEQVRLDAEQQDRLWGRSDVADVVGKGPLLVGSFLICRDNAVKCHPPNGK